MNTEETIDGLLDKIGEYIEYKNVACRLEVLRDELRNNIKYECPLPVAHDETVADYIYTRVCECLPWE